MNTICFDVNGTLINVDDTPRYDTIQLVKYFDKIGWKVYIWSSCGRDYGIYWIEKLGLDFPVIEKGSIKPEIAVDDNNVTFGKVNIKV
jgi:hydroxymethylpyrimidine pyrophosphatase-like HAD family hydrolase